MNTPLAIQPCTHITNHALQQLRLISDLIITRPNLIYFARVTSYSEGLGQRPESTDYTEWELLVNKVKRRHYVGDDEYIALCSRDRGEDGRTVQDRARDGQCKETSEKLVCAHSGYG